MSIDLSSERDKCLAQEAKEVRRNDLFKRAFAAYYLKHPNTYSDMECYPREPMKNRAVHPDTGYCFVNQIDGTEYVVLANMKGPLAVYRVAVRGQLQRLKQYAARITDIAEHDDIRAIGKALER